MICISSFFELQILFSSFSLHKNILYCVVYCGTPFLRQKSSKNSIDFLRMFVLLYGVTGRVTNFWARMT